MAKTVRVRIAVAVNENGHWACSGWSSASDADLSSNVMDFVPLEGTVHLITFVEATVPLPVNPEAVEGSVSP